MMKDIGDSLVKSMEEAAEYMRGKKYVGLNIISLRKANKREKAKFEHATKNKLETNKNDER